MIAVMYNTEAMDERAEEADQEGNIGRLWRVASHTPRGGGGGYTG